MTSLQRTLSFRYRLRESLLILLGRLPRRLTTVEAVTTCQSELAQSRAELSRTAKATAEARARLSVVELDFSRLREENARLRQANIVLEEELQAARAKDATIDADHFNS
jgi:hypothetical protein